MSKVGSYLKPNWFNDQGWSRKDVLALLRRNWKQLRKVANARDAAERKYQVERNNRLEVFVMSPEAAELERAGLNPAYRGPPASRLNYPYRGRGQSPAA